MQALTVVSDKKKSFFEIHDEAMGAAHNIKTHYLKLFEILMLVESRQIYHQFEVPSLYVYCTELLDLSPSISNDFINVVRKSLEIPELANAIRSRKLTISKARKICPVITPTDHKQWIELAEACSSRVVEKAVAQANPKTSVRESMKYISQDVLEFKLAVSEEWQVLLQKTKDQLSQKYKRAVSSEEALFILMQENFSKNDPVEKAKKALRKVKAPKVDVNAEANPIDAVKSRNQQPDNNNSRYRSALVEHIVTLRDQNQCTYVDQKGRRCEQKRWLHKHHIHEFAKGGSHSPANLETLCTGHHKIRHLKMGARHVTSG